MTDQKPFIDEKAQCPGLCDFCYPDGHEDCIRPAGHEGPHSCQPGEA